MEQEPTDPGRGVVDMASFKLLYDGERHDIDAEVRVLSTLVLTLEDDGSDRVSEGL